MKFVCQPQGFQANSKNLNSIKYKSGWVIELHFRIITWAGYAGECSCQIVTPFGSCTIHCTSDQSESHFIPNAQCNRCIINTFPQRFYIYSLFFFFSFLFFVICSLKERFLQVKLYVYVLLFMNLTGECLCSKKTEDLQPPHSFYLWCFQEVTEISICLLNTEEKVLCPGWSNWV